MFKSIVITESALIKRSPQQADQVIILDQLHDNNVQLSSEEQWEIWREAYEKAQTWYLIDNIDVTLFNGISFGSVITIEMWYLWCKILEHVTVLQKIITAYEPQKIILLTRRNNYFASLLRALQFQNICVIPQNSTLQMYQQLSSTHWIDLAKTMEIDRYLRLLALGARRKMRDKPKGSVETLALLELPGSYYAETLLAVMEHLPNTALLLMDPRHFSRADMSGKPFISFADYVFPFLKGLLKHVFYWKDVFGRFQNELKTRFCSSDICLWSVMTHRIKRVFSFKFPLLSIEMMASEEVLRQYAIKCLLLVSDAHHGARLLTFVGQRLGIPSVVVQHGWPFAEWGYLPLYADAFAAWGEHSRQWMIERGADPDRVIVTGSPRMDQIVSRDQPSRAILQLPANGKLILWAVDPAPVAYNRSILEQLIQAVRRYPEFQLIVRPHPSMHEYHWLKDGIHQQPQIHLSSPHHNLYDVIACCDAVIIQGSTVGLEALALHRPVILFPYQNHDYLRRVYPNNVTFHCVSLEGLINVFDKIARREVRYDDQDGFYQQFIVDTFYKIDGNSAARVAEVVRKLAKRVM